MLIKYLFLFWWVYSSQKSHFEIDKKFCHIQRMLHIIFLIEDQPTPKMRLILNSILLYSSNVTLDNECPNFKEIHLCALVYILGMHTAQSFNFFELMKYMDNV